MILVGAFVAGAAVAVAAATALLRWLFGDILP